MRGIGKINNISSQIFRSTNMEKHKNLSRYILAFFALAMFALFVRCQDEMVVETSDPEPTTDQTALEKLGLWISQICKKESDVKSEAKTEVFEFKLLSNISENQFLEAARALINMVTSNDWADGIKSFIITMSFIPIISIIVSQSN